MRDLFDTTDYQVFYEASIWEDYEDFVYFIQRNRHEKAVEIASRESIDSNEIIRPSGDTVMHVWAEFGREKLFEHFAKKGGDHYMKNYAGETPFHIAAREGKLTILEFYLKNYEINIDVKTKDGWTPFHYASFNGYTTTMEYLIKNGADINMVDKFNRTALHWAARFENGQTVDKLLKLKINYSIQDIEGNTAFDIARSKKFYEVAWMINEFHIAKSQDHARKITMMKNARKIK